MQLTEFKDIEKYVDTLLALPVFSSTGKTDELKKYLLDQLYILYEENPKDVVNLFNRSFNINPISIAFTMSLGILEHDVETAISYFITDIIKLLYQKADFNNLQYLKVLLQKFGLTINVYKVIVKNTSSYIGEEVESGEIIDLAQEEFVDNKHLISLAEYQTTLKQDQYDTIVIKIKIENTLYFDKYTYSPPPILQAYAFTKYYDSDMQFFMSEPPAYSHNVVVFFKTLRYLYLKYIEFNNPGFDIGTDPIDNYWYMIHETADLDAMHELCEYYFYNLKTRDNFEYYTRAERLLLNEVTVDKGHSSISDLRVELYSIDHNIVEEIDSYTTEEEYTNAFINMRTSILIKINNSDRSDKIDELALMVFLYLVNLIMVATDTLKNQISELMSTYIKYFLPIYTDVSKEFDFVYKIGDRYNKIYADDKVDIKLRSTMWGLVDPRDTQNVELGEMKQDLVLLCDSHTIGYGFYCNYDIKDDPRLIILERAKGLIDTKDQNLSTPIVYRADEVLLSSSMRSDMVLPFMDMSLLELHDFIAPAVETFNIDVTRMHDYQLHSVIAENKYKLETSDEYVADINSSFDTSYRINDDPQITPVVNYEDQELEYNEETTSKISGDVSSDEGSNIDDNWQFTIYNDDGSEKETVSSDD